MGSPPRVRGKGSEQQQEELRCGITPACAGKSRMPSTSRTITGDHPRVCGEKPPSIPQHCCTSGSPPRVRGKENLVQIAAALLRITPACAGKRIHIMRISLSLRDHPRVCGEKAYSSATGRSSTGSPPRVRGKEVIHLLLILYLRITPACAGKSVFLLYVFVDVWDHPRVCGEKCPDRQ